MALLCITDKTPLWFRFPLGKHVYTKMPLIYVGRSYCYSGLRARDTPSALAQGFIHLGLRVSCCTKHSCTYIIHHCLIRPQPFCCAAHHCHQKLWWYHLVHRQSIKCHLMSFTPGLPLLDFNCHPHQCIDLLNPSDKHHSALKTLLLIFNYS